MVRLVAGTKTTVHSGGVAKPSSGTQKSGRRHHPAKAPTTNGVEEHSPRFPANVGDAPVLGKIEDWIHLEAPIVVTTRFGRFDLGVGNSTVIRSSAGAETLSYIASLDSNGGRTLRVSSPLNRLVIEKIGKNSSCVFKF